MAQRPIVAISMGDPSGIGAEVIAAALADRRVERALVPRVFGDRSTFQRFPVLRRLLTSPAPGGSPSAIGVTTLAAADRRPGVPTLAGGRAQLAYLNAAIDAVEAGQAEALCTAPVSKEQIAKTGVPFTGHTGLLGKRFGREVLMLMDGPRIRVALATEHLPISRVPRALKVDKLVRQLQLLSNCLHPALGRRPKIAVCGLNPHAGEGGTIGTEETTVLLPAIRRARKLGVDGVGPLAADGLFAQANDFPYDVALAMYHDQGLVAAKALDFSRTVNVTLGLPFPRTSPDHGVAYSLAGTGLASAEPMIAALLKAAELALVRRRVSSEISGRAKRRSGGPQ